MYNMEQLVSTENAWYGRGAPAIYDAPHLCSSKSFQATGFGNNVALNQISNPMAEICNELTVKTNDVWVGPQLRNLITRKLLWPQSDTLIA